MFLITRAPMRKIVGSIHSTARVGGDVLAQIDQVSKNFLSDFATKIHTVAEGAGRKTVTVGDVDVAAIHTSAPLLSRDIEIDMYLPRSHVRRYIKETLPRISAEALTRLQQYLEMYIQKVLTRAVLAMMYTTRVTLAARDVQFACMICTPTLTSGIPPVEHLPLDSE
jgi:histone H3/H4